MNKKFNIGSRFANIGVYEIQEVYARRGGGFVSLFALTPCGVIQNTLFGCSHNKFTFKFISIHYRQQKSASRGKATHVSKQIIQGV